MLDALEKQPILGYGVQGFWQPWRGEENPAGHIIAARGFIPPNGHNGFLDLALEVGYTGLALFLLSITFNFARAVTFWRQSKSVASVFPLIIILYVIMSNISETQLFITNYIWFSYVCVAVRLNMKSSDSIPSISERN
jgi:exopolysaccharide production protein ExoQ